jgi:tetratricopeptide (TPR) repeat protein
MLFAAPIVLVALGGSALAQRDTVTLKTGETQEVVVTSADYDAVNYKMIGKDVQSRFKWPEVQNVRYGSAADLYRAVDAMNAGKVQDAATALDKLAGDAKLRPVVRQEVLFTQGLAARRLGDVDKAIGAWRELLKSFPKSRYLIATGGNLMGALLSKGDVGGASKTLDDLTAAAKTAGLDAAAQNSFGLLRARILLEQKKYAEAQNSFAQVASASGISPDVVTQAKYGLAFCAQMQGKTADAEKSYRELTTADAENTVLAGAWNGLGDLALEIGRSKRDPEKLRDALFCYLRGVVLYGPTQEETTDEHERALAGAANAFESLGQLETNAENKKTLIARAREKRSQLETQFPGSRWLPKK